MSDADARLDLLRSGSARSLNSYRKISDGPGWPVPRLSASGSVPIVGAWTVRRARRRRGSGPRCAADPAAVGLRGWRVPAPLPGWLGAVRGRAWPVARPTCAGRLAGGSWPVGCQRRCGGTGRRSTTAGVGTRWLRRRSVTISDGAASAMASARWKNALAATRSRLAATYTSMICPCWSMARWT